MNRVNEPTTLLLANASTNTEYKQSMNSDFPVNERKSKVIDDEQHDIIRNVADLPLDLLSDQIFAFVGNHQYRFVGGVSKSFAKAYAAKFPEKRTNYNLSSIKLANISYEEAPSEDKPSLKRRSMNQPWYYYVHCQDICDLELLLWAKLTLGCPYTTCMVASTTDAMTCSMAAKHGDLQMLQWARMNGCPWDSSTCSSAAENGHLEVLQWARMNGCPWDKYTCAFAANNGHLGVLQWAHETGCPWDSSICSFAAENGHLEVIQWAHVNGCPWDTYTCAFAANNGHLGVLQWAHMNGCPWDA